MSLCFYTWGEKELVVLIIISTLIDFSCGLIIQNGQRQIGLFLSIVFNIGILAYFKYSGFIFTNLVEFLGLFNVTIESAHAFSNVVLPLGISFYTFQTMSYTIDVYRGETKANKNIIDFATYVTMFPQLIAGPIVRYKTIEKELSNRKVTSSLMSEGIERFVIGLAKKMLIANNCALLADNIFNLHHDDLSTGLAWLGVIAYSFQIYFDFSGYSDMAIGLGKMLGFNFPENFKYPYTAKSIREFWKRWHITLSTWFRDYLYIPLGGNRNSNTRTYVNLFVVFFITGLWHGANWTFIIWGLFHGILIAVERLGLGRILSRVPKIIAHVYLIFSICISWVFFRSDSLSEAIHYIGAMFNFKNQTNLEFLNYYLSTELLIVLVLATVLSMPVYHKSKLLIKKIGVSYKILASMRVFSLLVLFICCLFYIATDSYNPFIYFRF
ncbi:MAG: MBOAT family O-acyltransferase [Gelidibacter sp.]